VKPLVVIVVMLCAMAPLILTLLVPAVLLEFPWMLGKAVSGAGDTSAVVSGPPSAPPPAGVSLPAGAPTSDVIAAAETWLGVPYLFGGCTRSGVDCSCFVELAFAAIGISLPRTAQAQWNATARVDQADLQPGDLVFFAHTYPSVDVITHVGIYLGDGLQLNAPDTGQVVSVQPVFSGFFGAHYAGAGRPRR
jgi:cell wall-associated NlpC family hydrolase